MTDEHMGDERDRQHKRSLATDEPAPAAYAVVSAPYIMALIDGVHEMMREGWRCQGGIAVDPTAELHQAMVKP